MKIEVQRVKIQAQSLNFYPFCLKIEAHKVKFDAQSLKFESNSVKFEVINLKIEGFIFKFLEQQKSFVKVLNFDEALNN